jgi:hypothetical protein
VSFHESSKFGKKRKRETKREEDCMLNDGLKNQNEHLKKTLGTQCSLIAMSGGPGFMSYFRFPPQA